MDSGNKQFSIDAQHFVVSNASVYGEHLIFIHPEVLEKYESRSGTSCTTLEGALKKAFSNAKTYFIQKEGRSLEVLPCQIVKPQTTNHFTDIKEGDSL